MSTPIDLHNHLDRNEVFESLEDRLALMEACVHGSMFLMHEEFGKEVPTAYALWHNLQRLKEDVANLRIMALRNTA